MNDTNNSLEDQPKKKPLTKRIERKLIMTLGVPIIRGWLKWFDYTGLKNDQANTDQFDMQELEERIRSRKNPSIIAIWHNRLVFGPNTYHYGNGIGAYVMVSKGFDGEMMNKLLGYYHNVFGVRGSASKPGQDKGGREALQEMIELAKQGYDMVLTPDGPHGPVYKAKRGVIEMARATGHPIYPVSANSSSYFAAHSWDKMRLPYPYSKIVFKAAKPIYVPKDADEDMMEQKRLELEIALKEITDFVDDYFK